MKKKTKAAIILISFLFLIFGSLFYLLLKPDKWINEFVVYLNDNILRDNGWELTIGDIDGKLISQLHLKNIYLRKSDGSVIIFGENSFLDLDFTKLLSGYLAIHDFTLENAVITVKSRTKKRDNQKLFFISDLVNRHFSIQQFSVSNSSVIINDGGKEKLYTLNLRGRLQTQNTNLLFVPENFQVLDLQTKQFVSIYSGDILLDGSGIRVKNLSGFYNNYPYVANGRWSIIPEQKLSVEVEINDIFANKLLPQYIVQIIDSKMVNVSFQFETDFSQTMMSGFINSSTDTLPLIKASMDLFRDKANWYVNNANFQMKSAILKGKGSLLSTGDFQLNLDVFDVNLNEFNLLAKNTQFNGDISLKGKYVGTRLEDLAASINLRQGIFGSDRYISVSGDLNFQNEVINIADSLQVVIGNGKLLAYGKVDLARERIDVSMSSLEGDLNSLLTLIGLDSLKGEIKGSVDIAGYLIDPSITGFISVSDAEYKNLSVNSLQFSFHINSAIKKRYGTFRAIASSGKFMNYPIEKGIFDIYLRGDTVQVANARLENQNDYLQVSGKLMGSNLFVVDQFQFAYQNQYITNLDQIKFLQEKDFFSLQPTELQINNGKIRIGMEGSSNGIEDIDILVTNIDLGSLQQILGKTFPVSGSVFGNVVFHNHLGDLEGNVSLEIKEGILSTIPFDRLLITTEMNDDLVAVDEFRIIGKDNDFTMAVSGYSHISQESNQGKYFVDPEKQINITSEFKNLDISYFQPLVPSSWNLKGSATGSFTIYGLAKDPEITYECVISSPQFHRISAETVSASGRYMDHRLYFEDLIGITKNGQYMGSGYLPIDLTLVTKNGNRFLNRDPIFFEFESQTSSLDFLTPYFEDIESITGDFDIELSISGTPENPIRNGKIKVSDGQINALLLEHPISNVNGTAILMNNKFIIQELNGSSTLPTDISWTERVKKNLAEATSGLLFSELVGQPAPNIRLTGSMDLTEFFKPNLAFLLTGEDVYIRTLLGEIEGIADVDLSITGKDTINISGDIVPSEAVLRMEFAGGKEYEKSIEKGGKMVANYQLHFPISGSFYVQNSQVDAELEGDMTIFRVGHKGYQYSGELNVLRGKFYYYSDVFDIHEGSLLFEPSAFNPKLDIHASTEIDGTEINVSLSGDLEEPVLIIEDTEQFYSQSDLLQLLTLQKRFVEQDLSSEGLKEQSLNVFGKIIENEFEKSLIRVSPLDEFEIEGSSNLLGSSEGKDLSLKVGKQVLPNLYLSYKRSFSLTQPDQLGIEYRLTRNLSLVGNYDEDGLYLKYRLKYQY